MRYLKFLCVLTALLFALTPLSASAAQSPLEKTVSNIEDGDYALNISQINTKDGVYEHLRKYLTCFTESNVELVGITVVDFQQAEEKTHHGGFSFFAELSYSNTRKTTGIIDGTINSFPVIITAVSSQSSISEGDEFTLNAEITDYDGGNVYWYESSNPNKNGTLLKKTKSTNITVSPGIGTKYYYCTYKGAISNTVSVKVTEAFVPISDITLPKMTLICNRSTHLPAEIYPDNATKSDIVWEVTGGDASIVSDRITVRTAGIITVKAKVYGGGDKGADYEKYFEFYAEEGAPEYKEIKWSIVPSVDGILQMTFTANEKKDIQVTAVSGITADKMIKASNTHSDMDMITSAYIVCDDINNVYEISIQLDSEYASKEIHVISSDENGSISHDSLTASEIGEIILPKNKSTYIITSAETKKTDLSFVLFLLPIIPLILLPIFFRLASDKKERKAKK